MFAALAVLAAACSDPSALGPADDEVAAGPTVLAEAQDNPDTEPMVISPTTTPTPTLPPLPTLPPPLPPPDPVTVLAIGNLGHCTDHTREIAAAVAADSGTIFAVGDLSLDGSQASIDECLPESLGTELDRIYAVPGDQDLVTDNGSKPNGQLALDDENGVMHFNVGGSSAVGFDDAPQASSQVRLHADGYVRFVFSPEGYTWEFVATSAEAEASDAGSGTC